MTAGQQVSVKLKKLLKGVVNESLWQQHPELADMTVSSIELDSRKLTTGGLFAAYPGHQTDGRNYIQQAVEADASVVVFEQQQSQSLLQNLLNDNQQVAASDTTLSGYYRYKEAVLIPVSNLSQQVSRIAARFYGNPTRKMSVVGVTGTNGKTSCAYLMAQALEFLHYPTLMLSTIGNGTPSQLTACDNTTPDAVSIQRLAAEYLEQKHYHMTMEVSSHGLVQGRVAGVNYKVAIFTNLSQDHLDYHGDMERYFEAKRQLFLSDGLEAAIINADDEYGRRLLADEAIRCQKIAYSSKQPDHDLKVQHWVTAQQASFNMQGIQAELHTPWGSSKLRSALLGHFNLSNLLAVAAALGVLLGDSHKWIVALNGAQAVPGRMQRFSAPGKATVVVDYAHTPDALEKTLASLRQHCDGKLWCIFGCGGDRDAGKRPLMGAAAEQQADEVIITDDNPRSEAREAIVAMIREGMRNKKVEYIAQRRQAIEYALGHSGAKDMILVAGKGHEDYQIIGSEKQHYSDLETVAELMEVSA